MIPSWSNPESFVDTALRAFRRDRWDYQSVRVEVWSEKGTIRGTLAPVLHDYGVTLRVFHGFSSATSIMEFVKEIRGADRPIHALYVGDHDPSGLYMSEMDLPNRLAEYGAHVHIIGAHGSRSRCKEGEYCSEISDAWRPEIDGVPTVSLERIALTREDCDGLPSFDVEEKRSDPRYNWYTSKGHDLAWELDAMSPPDLRDRVEDAILERIDRTAWERTGLSEAAEQASLREILGQWPSISRQVSE